MDRHLGGLGRGLSSLIPTRPADDSGAHEIPLAQIAPNPFQPRRHVDEEELTALVASIREHGLLQPVIVTQSLEGYVLVAGERRIRAARQAGLERIPAVVRQLADRDQLELAIVENVQREDLDPIEEALAYRQLIDDFGLTQEDVAIRVGRTRVTIANRLRLLDAAPEVQSALIDDRITEGHARALVGLPLDAQVTLLRTVLQEQLSVRQTEELVRRVREPREPSAPRAQSALDPDLERVEEELRRSLGTKVSLSRSRKGGRIVIEYYSDDELGRLYERLTGGTA